METFTKIVKGKELKKIIDIPDKLNDRDLKITAELIEKKSNSKDNRLEKLFEEADKLDFKIPKNLNVDDVIDEINY